MTADDETAREKEYDDIPGTFVFDAERSRQGYHINMFCMSLMKDENRRAFKQNEAEYLDRFPLTPDQRDAVLTRNYNRLLELGGNIYFTAKLGATDGHSFQHMAAVMTGATQEDYAKMMLGGGRSVEGNRSKSGREPVARKTAPRSGAKAAPAKASAGRAAKKPAARKPVAAKPATRKASAGKAPARKPAGRKAAERKPVARKPAGRKPAGRPAAKRGKTTGSKRG